MRDDGKGPERLPGRAKVEEERALDGGPGRLDPLGGRRSREGACRGRQRRVQVITHAF